MKHRHKRRLAILSPLLIVAGVYLYWSRPLALGGPSDFSSVEIELIDRATEDHPTQSRFVTSTDAAAIASLVETLESGSRILDCRCIWCGFVRLKDNSGTTREMQLVPGHGDDTYDIRCDGRRYSIDRARLQEGLEALGAELPDFKPASKGSSESRTNSQNSTAP